MPLTPEDVRNKRFTPVRLREGYDMGEVDQFLDEVEAELERLLKENDDLRTKLTSSQRVPVPMLKDAATARPGTLEGKIYEAMSKEAFAEIRDHYLAQWTKKGEAPPKP